MLLRSLLRSWSRHHAVVATLCHLAMLAALASMSSVALFASLPAFLESTGDAEAVSNLPGFGTIFLSVGKCTVVWTLQRFGARQVLILAALLVGIGALSITLTGHAGFGALFGGVAAMQFALSQVWAGCTMLTANWVDRSQLGRTFGFAISGAGDLGGAIAALGFGAILEHTGPDGWPVVFAVVGSLSLCVSALLWAGLCESAADAGHRPPRAEPSQLAAEDEPEEDLATSKTAASAPAAQPQPHLLGDSRATAVPVAVALRVFSRSVRVWLAVLMGTCCACVVTAAQIVPPLYASQRLHASAADAARMPLAVQIGAVAGGLLGGLARDGLSPRDLLRVTAAVMLCGVGGAAGWWVADLTGTLSSPLALAPMLFVMAISVSWAWGVLQSAFTVTHGGPAHSSTLMGLLDAVSFLPRAPAAFLLGHLMKAGRWQTVCFLILAVGAVGNATALLLLAADQRMPAAPSPLSEPSGGAAVPVDSASVGGDGSRQRKALL